MAVDVGSCAAGRTVPPAALYRLQHRDEQNRDVDRCACRSGRTRHTVASLTALPTNAGCGAGFGEPLSEPDRDVQAAGFGVAPTGEVGERTSDLDAVNAVA
jgi:hypothetical protein